MTNLFKTIDDLFETSFSKISVTSKFITPLPIDKKSEPKNNQTDRHTMALSSKFISQIY